MSSKKKKTDKKHKGNEELRKLTKKVDALKSRIDALEKEQKKLKAQLKKLGKKSAVKAIPVLKKEKVEKPPREIDTPPAAPAKKDSLGYSALDAIAQLKSLKTPDEVLEFTAREKRVSVKKLVAPLIKKLTSDR